MDQFLLIFVLLVLTTIVAEDKLYFSNVNKRPDPKIRKSAKGWREPGIWRPKWIIERHFKETKDSEPYSDKIYVRLRSNKTIKIFNQDSRPKLEWRNKEAMKKKIKFFDDKIEDDNGIIAMERIFEEGNTREVEKYDGVWEFKSYDNISEARISIETREKDKNGKVAKYLLKTKNHWGSNDPYAAKFGTGKVFKYRLTSRGIPIGSQEVGIFNMYVSPHRPLVGKDFLAFQ